MATPTNLANIYKAGLWSSGPYQVAGKPFISGNLNVSSLGVTKIEFPTVTSWIQLYNLSSSPVNVAFSENGLYNNNYFQLNDGYRTAQGGRAKSFTGRMPLKITELWLSASVGTLMDPTKVQNVSVVAGLTSIPNGQITAISPSGPNWSGSIGVG